MRYHTDHTRLSDYLEVLHTHRNDLTATYELLRLNPALWDPAKHTDKGLVDHHHFYSNNNNDNVHASDEEYYYNGDVEGADRMLESLLATPGWAAFGHIAAEADLAAR